MASTFSTRLLGLIGAAKWREALDIVDSSADIAAIEADVADLQTDVAALTGALEAPSGTVLLFFNSAAPTGWTKDTTNYNDHAIRIVTGTPSSGGSSDFSTVFGKTATDNFTLTTSHIPAHDHNFLVNNATNTTVTGGGARVVTIGVSGSTITTSSTGSGSAHAHNIDLRVKYVDAIRATKD